MIVYCSRCGVGNFVTREKWKCKKCSTKHTTVLSKPEPKRKSIVKPKKIEPKTSYDYKDEKEIINDDKEDKLEG